jgi:hypothetical protein
VEIERRSAERFAIQLPLRVEEEWTRTIDLSVTGIRFATSRSPLPGQAIHLFLNLPDRDVPMVVELDGRVVRIEAGAQTNLVAATIDHLMFIPRTDSRGGIQCES